jgi:GTP-binding protein
VFVDEARIWVEAGRGGDGAVAFRREKYVPRGGPAGGDGGRGGDVVFVVDSGLNTLLDFQHRRHFRAEDGAPGEGANRAGRSGTDLVVRVPPGTRVFRDEDGVLLADLTEPGMRWVAARGGRGGKGNARFKSSTHRTPRFAERGEPGEALWLRLELVLLADVGLVGFPNVGKSTLLTRWSAARPAVADYPFTTLTPHLGVVDRFDRPFVLADVPGLIEGAHAGHGLGDRFLRHLSRTRLLVHLLDLSPYSGRDPVADWHVVRRELAAWGEPLASRPEIVAVNKIDLPQARARVGDVAAAIGQPVFPISAQTGEGLDALGWAIRQALDRLPPPPLQTPAPVVRPRPVGFAVVREADGALRVVGDVEARAVRTAWGNRDAEAYLAEYLRRRGVTEALAAEAPEDGTLVRVGPGALIWRGGGLMPVDTASDARV